MKNLTAKIKAMAGILYNFLKRYLELTWVPIILILLFIAQNHFFNNWLNILPGHFLIRRTFVTAALGGALFGPSVLFTKKKKYIYLGAVSTIIALLFIIQFLYHSYSGGFLQVSAIFYATEGLTVLSTVQTLLTYHLLFFTLGPLAVVVCLLAERKGYFKEKILSKKEKITVVASLIALIIFGYGYLFFRENKEAGNMAHLYQYNRLFDINALVSKIGVINFSFGDVLSAALTTDEASADQLNFVKKWRQEKNIASPTSTNFGLAKGRNLIFIQVESLENAVIGEKIGGLEITPNLNKLASSGLYFDNYYAQIGPGTTADAEFSIQNSLYPLSDTVAFIKYAYNDYLALPSLLSNNGYSTYSLHGDVASFWNRANMYPRLGYQKWFSQPDYIIPRDIGAYRLGDEDFFNQSIDKLKTMPQPFMSVLITLTSHTPFKLPTDLDKLPMPTSTTLSTLQQNYLKSAHYTDAAIGKFIEDLKQNNLYDNSLIFIFGDHGSFTNIAKALSPDKGKTIFADLQNSQVPLIILAPNTKLRGKSHAPASHIDIYPTAINLLGIKTSSTILGKDIINTKNHITTSRNLISGTVKSIITDKLAYHAGEQGNFENGICVELPSLKRLPVENCRALYQQESDTLLVSDLMVKNNLIKNPD